MERYGASAAPEILKRPRGLVKIIGLRLDEPEGAHLRHALQAHLTPSLTPPWVPTNGTGCVHAHTQRQRRQR